MELTSEIIDQQIREYLSNGGTITVYPTPRTRIEKKRPWMLAPVPQDKLYDDYPNSFIYSDVRRDFDQPAPAEIRELENNDNGR